MSNRFDAQEVLSSLKPFQRETADYVWDRFNNKGVRRFLVADEVGLGKTIVAKGIIAHLIETSHSDSEFDRSDTQDIVYICSNENIARQNLRKLNLLDKDTNSGSSITSRLTLLPFDKRMSELEVGWRFLSFTPGTTFHSGRSSGQASERALIWHLLEGSGLHAGTKDALMRGSVNPENFDKWYKKSAQKTKAEMRKNKTWQRIHEEFKKKIKNESSPLSENDSLLSDLSRIGREFASITKHTEDRKRKRISRERNIVVGKLREILAHIALRKIKPRLVIFDEFQRFADLFDQGSDADQAGGGAGLMRTLLEGEDTLSLFLSATPYRMLSLRGENAEGGEHHQAFLKTIAQLYGESEDGKVAEALKREFREFREFLHKLPAHDARLGAIDRKTNIEGHLRPVVARTERTSNTVDRDSMVETRVFPAPVDAADLRDLEILTHLGDKVGSRDLIEFWKSSPYLLDFMAGYHLNRQVKKFADGNPADWKTLRKKLGKTRLKISGLNNFQNVDFRNGRLRVLVREILDAPGEFANRLWLPPSLPYQQPDPGSENLTKSLIFSGWNMVPEAIVALLSYEAERRMTEAERRMTGRVDHKYFDKDDRKLLPLKMGTEDVQSGFSLVPLIYPSRFLAKTIDPLAIRREFSVPPSYEELHKKAVAILRQKLAEFVVDYDLGKKRPQIWECVRYFNGEHLDDDERSSIAEALRTSGEDGDEDGDEYTDRNRKSENAMFALIGQWHDTPSLGKDIRFDEKSLSDLAELALGSPATCAYRAFRRLEVDEPNCDHQLAELKKARLLAAVCVARGFRTLFNRREVVGMLRPDNAVGWVSVLNYCARHDLQATLDEFIFILQSETNFTGAEKLRYLSEHIRRVVATNASHITLRDPIKTDSQRHQIRGHFAMRLAETKGSEQEAKSGKFRAESVREAFNSPFRPFVLASTSVGQEGLDFHNYCYKLWHWNIPGNPIDLEQREGRVQRYMGHAVRLNIIQKYGSAVLGGSDNRNPWNEILSKAVASFSEGNGLSPHWIMDGDVKVKRCVPLPPLSRDAEKFRLLLKSLAIYRLAFGQPRQEDLLKYLEKVDDNKVLSNADWEEMQVSLVPR
ncbi:MAG: hypothetical protein JKY94_10740 [Rhodobacteraceae bacterium]|nr:hypothetical protein [Paracoccaceae bacterium]